MNIRIPGDLQPSVALILRDPFPLNGVIPLPEWAAGISCLEAGC